MEGWSQTGSFPRGLCPEHAHFVRYLTFGSVYFLSVCVCACVCVHIYSNFKCINLKKKKILQQNFDGEVIGIP